MKKNSKDSPASDVKLPEGKNYGKLLRPIYTQTLLWWYPKKYPKIPKKYVKFSYKMINSLKTSTGMD